MRQQRHHAMADTSAEAFAESSCDRPSALEQTKRGRAVDQQAAQSSITSASASAAFSFRSPTLRST
jgi:hypothetical protein